MKSNIRFNLKFNVESNLEFNSQTNSASNFESLTLPSDMVRMIRMIRMRLHLEHSESRNIKRLTSCNFEIRWFPKTSESLLRRVCKLFKHCLPNKLARRERMAVCCRKFGRFQVEFIGLDSLKFTGAHCCTLESIGTHRELIETHWKSFETNRNPYESV